MPPLPPPRLRLGESLERPPKGPRLKSDPKPILFFIDFGCHFGSILGPIWEPFGTPFGVKIDPRSVQDALLSIIFFKNTIFTEPL